MIKTFIIGLLCSVCVCLGYRVQVLSDHIRNAPAAATKEVPVYHQQCPGCGNWFWTEVRGENKPPKPIEAPCPLCPMTEEEFEDLQEQLRRERDGKP